MHTKNYKNILNDNVQRLYLIGLDIRGYLRESSGIFGNAKQLIESILSCKSLKNLLKILDVSSQNSRCTIPNNTALAFGE